MKPKDKELSDNAKKVLLAIYYADEKGLELKDGQICKETGITQHELDEAILELSELGFAVRSYGKINEEAVMNDMNTNYSLHVVRGLIKESTQVPKSLLPFLFDLFSGAIQDEKNRDRTEVAFYGMLIPMVMMFGSDEKELTSVHDAHMRRLIKEYRVSFGLLAAVKTGLVEVIFEDGEYKFKGTNDQEKWNVFFKDLQSKLKK